MRVDVWSDVVCPFCYIGKKRLEHVAAEAGIDLEIHWHSFELDPDAPAKHDTSNTERLAKKYGRTYEEMEEMERNIAAMAAQGVTAFSLEAAPRTTRAQSMDVLSSQANIAGYKAVMVAANEYQRFMPMLMTAAGTVKAARILILGAGVAGLQAIATAKRLGAVIEASDVRPAAKEQIESLGAKFVDVPYETDEEREIAQGVGGYARPMPEAWMKRQAGLVAERAQQADIVITTALIPGRKPPVLLHSDTVANMKPGSVVIDLAAGKGDNGSGNCPLTQADKIIDVNGVKIVGYTNLPSMVAADASALYARNLLDFLKLIVDKEAKLVIPSDDDIVTACLMCRDGQAVRKN